MAGNLLQVGLRGKLVAGGVIEGKILGCLNVEMERRALSLHSSKFQFGPPHLRTASRVKPVAGRVIEGQTLGCLNVEKWNVERDKGPALKRTSKIRASASRDTQNVRHYVGQPVCTSAGRCTTLIVHH